MTLHPHLQPASRFTDGALEFNRNPRSKGRCSLCRRVRSMFNLRVEVKPDGYEYSCAGGCHKKVIL
jgi:hypothetical protein